MQEIAQLLGLENLLTRKPKQLSGGQRQRVAMGRAIVRNPKLFLFDEPLSNLDAKLRVQMRLEIKKLHKKLGVISLYTISGISWKSFTLIIAVLFRSSLSRGK